MAEKRSEDLERRRRDPETRTGPDPAAAAAEPAMPGAGEEGTGRRLDPTSLVLVLVVVALLALLAYVLFATHGGG